MKKRAKGRKLHRTSDQRKALMKTLSSALILHGKIKTTEAKAREMAGFVEKKITIAKKGDLSSRRLLAGLFSPQITKKLIEEVASSCKDRKGGYTRIIKLGRRKTEGAKMAIIELVK